MVVHDVRDETLPGVRRDDHDRHAEPIAIEVRRGISLEQQRCHVIRHACGGRRNVVVEAAVLVVGEEEGGARPERAGHRGLDHARDEGLADLDVRRRVLVALRIHVAEELRVDEGDRRQGARGGVDRELLVGHEMLAVLPHVRHQEGERHLRVVDVPAHAGLVERLEDALRRAGEVQIVPDVAERGPEQQVLAVRVGGPEQRREVAVPDREGAVQREVVGQLALLVEAEGTPALGIRRDGVARREAVHRPAVPLRMGGVPGVGDVGHLARGLLVERLDRRPAQRVGVRGAPGRTLRRAPAARPETAEVVVEGAVLLHQHHDVVDRDLVAVRRAGGKRLRRQRAGLERARAAGGSGRRGERRGEEKMQGQERGACAHRGLLAVAGGS